MTKLLCFFFGLNCFSAGWVFTGVLLWWICFAIDFKEQSRGR